MTKLCRSYCRSIFTLALLSFVATCGFAATAVQQVSPAAGPIIFAATAIGGGTSTQSVQLQLGVNGTVSISVPASANGHQEFTVGTISGCTADGVTVNTSGTTCTVPVTFQPYYPGQRSQPLAVTVAGQVYSFALTGMGTGPLLRLDPTNISTLTGAAGTSATTASPDNVAISAGIIYGPEGLYVDNSNNLYIADSSHNRVRIAYQTANPQLACLIITESPTTFGLSAGANTCAGATSQPTVGYIYTIAGNNSATYVADNVLASSTATSATGVAADAYGNVYIADESNGRVRVVYEGGANVACMIVIENPTLFGLASGANTCVGATSQPTQGFIYTLAGTGTAGYSGDGGLAKSAKLYTVQDIAVDSAGDVFMTNFSASLTPTIGGRVRVIYNGGAAAAQLISLENPTLTPTVGFIYTVAGNLTTEGGDGTLATSGTAGMLDLYSMKIDSYDNLYLADKTYGSTGLPLAVNRIRVVYNGTAASPNPLASLIALENPSLTAQPGYIYTVAGGAGTTATAATKDGVLATTSQFAGIYGVAVDPAGDILIADRLNYTIRRVSAATGLISTIAGQPSATQGIASGSAQPGQALLWGPWGIVVDSAGGLYASDNGANRVRNIGATPTSTFPLIIPATTTTASGPSALTPFLATNIGTPGSTLTLTADSATSPFGFLSPANAPGVSECAATSTSALTTPTLTTPVSLSSGSSCSFGIAGQPLNGGVTTGNASVTSNSGNTTGSVFPEYLSITASGVQTVLSATPTPITGGNPTILKATLTTTGSSPVPVTSGSVSFSITGGASLGSATLDPVLGTASVTTSQLAAPTTSITTTYAGATAVNPLFTASSSVTVLTVSAKPATTIGLMIDNATPNLGQSIALTATVGSSTAAGPFTGNVTFSDTQGTTTTTLGAPVTVTSAGMAVLNISTLSAGTHSITATYGNDLAYASAGPTTAIKVVVTAPAYSVTENVAGIAIQTGQMGTVVLTATSVGGYAGTLTAGCSGGPAGVRCTFAPSSLVFTGVNTTQTMNVSISTTINASLEPLQKGNGDSTLFAIMLWLPGSLAGLFGLRRRRAFKRWQQATLMTLVICGGLVGIGTLAGCTASQNVVAPYGTFNLPITVSDGTTATTLTVTVSILGNSSVH